MTALIQSKEALDSLASEITTRHDTCEFLQDGAIDAIHKTITARVEISKMVETAHSILGGARFVQWWRDLGLPPGWAKKYMTLARTAGRNIIGDKSQLRLCGILPEAESGDEGTEREHNPFQWTGYVGKIRMHLNPAAINAMTKFDRDVALHQIEPVLEQMQGIVRELRGDGL